MPRSFNGVRHGESKKCAVGLKKQAGRRACRAARLAFALRVFALAQKSPANIGGCKRINPHAQVFNSSRKT
jgi:hypothetical protein